MLLKVLAGLIVLFAAYVIITKVIPSIEFKKYYSK
jgi:hypothetical protein